MLIKADSLDDALGKVMRPLLKKGRPILAKKGRAREFSGALVRLSDPRARFSRTEGRGTLFSSIGETLWYLAGSDRLDHIEYYIPQYRKFIEASRHKVVADGAYGPRLFGGGDKSQIATLIATLKKKLGRSDTRQAVVEIFRSSDLRPGNGDVPCTIALQYLPRQGKLEAITMMRSNDIYRGFPGDVFAFTFLQELIARTLGLEVGSYSHFVGSLHLYDDDQAEARKYLDEGFQEPISMPPMPAGDPWAAVKWLLEVEQAIRLGQAEPTPAGIDAYWTDLARLLRIKALHKQKNIREIALQKRQMASPIYDAAIRGRQGAAIRRQDAAFDLLNTPFIAQEPSTL